MKDVEGTLRRIDEEIVAHKQNIARSQVEITRLQDTRLVLMGMAEGDMAAAEAAKLDRIQTINGAHAKPVLIVRKEGSVDEPKKKQPKVRDYDHEREMRNARKQAAAAAGGGRTDARKGVHPGSAVEDMRVRILTLLKATGDLKRVEIGDKLGLPRGEKNRKAMSNAVYSLLKRGKLKQDYGGRFGLKSRE